MKRTGFENRYVILSTPLIIGQGSFQVRDINLKEALDWVNTFNPNNFCGHETTKILGIEPDKSRATCTGYDEALCISSKKRLEFGREYSVDEIISIGVNFKLIVFIGNTQECNCGSGQANDMCTANDPYCG